MTAVPDLTPEPVEHETLLARLRPQFSPVISMGNLLTIGGIILPAIGWFFSWMQTQQARIDNLQGLITVERVSRIASHRSLAQREQLDTSDLRDQMTADSAQTQQQLAAIQAILHDIQHRIDNRWDNHARK
jgi:hypothetical protein